MKLILVTLAAGALLLTGCSSDKEPEAFEADIIYAGNSDRNYPDSCTFAEGEVGAGDSVIVRGADDRILGKGALAVRTISMSHAGATSGPCSFETTIEIPAGDAGYQIILDGLDGMEPHIFDEKEMRAGPVIDLQSSIEKGLAGLSGR
ncbi:hypothetical protein [Rhodococcus sp. 1168]|uniref:hypothetical protein n=1 Tax=Rhodococcus sp. 1168 TaxID=2018041 RepID=UPI000A0D42A3|nr:hypothetical protein [Rhodococcus sp. 1168]ORI13414.1 hypothetical protein BJI47_22480 [Rhodococcus sp. 1168]